MYPFVWPRGISILLKNPSEISPSTGLEFGANVTSGSMLQRIPWGKSCGSRGERNRSPHGMGFDDPGADIDGSVLKPIHWVVSEVIVRNRVREASIRMHLVLENITHSLAVERPVRKIRPNNKLVLGNIRGSRVSQSPLAAIHDLRSVCKASMPEEEPLFPTASVLVDLERINTDLGLEERGGGCAVGKRNSGVSRAIVVHGRSSR